MKELLEASKALERLGAEWKARQATKKSLLDTIECTTLFQADEGVIRGLVEVRNGDTWRTKMEVACYLGGRLKEDGTFKHLQHPKHKTVKVFEYQNVILYRYSGGLFGLGAGFRPIGPVPAKHQYLADFAGRLLAAADQQEQAEKSARAADEDVRKAANEAKARRALFGPVL